MKITFLSSGEKLKKFRRKQYDAQNGICPILNKKIDFADAVLDHLHTDKKNPIGVNNGGELRGVIHNYCNSTEGRFLKIFNRSGLAKIISFPDFLIALGLFLKNPLLKDCGIFHPTEKPKAKTIGKREFKRIQKYWKQTYPKRKMPTWKEKLRKGKKTGKMNLTGPIKEALDKANKIHYSKYK